MIRNKLFQNFLFRTNSNINKPGDLIYINPLEIKDVCYNTDSVSDAFSYQSIEKSGNWDQILSPINSIPIHQALNQYFREGLPLEKLEMFEYNKPHKDDVYLNKNNSKWKIIDKNDIDNKRKHIDDLFQSIKNHGYKTQTELKENPYDEIKVKISRDGNILFEDGIHRFTIAQILQLTNVPAIVRVRHKRWVEFKNELKSYAVNFGLSAKPGYLYQKPYHPDLLDIPYVHESEDRFEAMKKNLISFSGSVIDIGSNLGYFCHSFETLGFKCLAVESDLDIVYFLNKIKIANKRKFEIYNDDFLKFINTNHNYDIAIAVNIFHHFLKTKDSYNKFINNLKNLKIKEMFFEPHDSEEIPAKSFYINPNPLEFVDLIKNICDFKKHDLILECSDNRKLFHLYN